MSGSFVFGLFSLLFPGAAILIIVALIIGIGWLIKLQLKDIDYEVENEKKGF